MRVAILAGMFLPVPPPKYGGTEQVIYHLIRGLKEIGHEPILYGPGDSQVDCKIVPVVDKATWFPLTSEEAIRFYGEDALKLFPEFVSVKKELLEKYKTDNLITQYNTKMQEAIRKDVENFDIIHSHGFDLRDFADLPNVTTLHGKINFSQFEHFEERKNLYYVSISNNQQEAFPDLQYVGTVYNGEDPADFPIVTQPEDYVCWLGRFDTEKNPHLAIELAIRLEIKIKLGGKYDHLGEHYFKEVVEPYFSNPLVEYLGELDLKQKAKLLSNAKCNLHPTGFREPFGLTVLEAAYCGTPTLAISRGSMPELIEEGRTGLLVEDFEEGYHRIQECFEMDREYIAQRSRALFNYKTMAKQYVKAYERVVEIYQNRELQGEAISTLLSQTKHDLDDIWKTNR